MTNNIGLVVMRKDIVKFCKKNFNAHSWQTVRYWKRRYCFPIRHLPNGQPFIIPSEVFDWAIKFDDLVQKNKALKY